MRQLRIAFFSGLCSLAAGAALPAAVTFSLRPQPGGAGTLQAAASLFGLLLAAGGGFMAVCTGPVLLATLLASPRGKKKD